MIKKFINVTSHALYPPPPPVTNCHTFSDPLPSSSVTYFMDGPLIEILSSLHLLFIQYSFHHYSFYSYSIPLKTPTSIYAVFFSLIQLLFIQYSFHLSNFY